MSITTEQRKQLLDMAESYDRGGHPDVAAIMRRNASISEDTKFNTETVLSELVTAEASYIW